MARITKPLTDTEVRQAKARDKQYTLSDGMGLFLRVRPNGTKNWMFDYYHPITKKRSVISFGSYPEIGLACARVKRTEARELIANLIDPKEQREQQHQERFEASQNTLKVVAERWLEVKSSQLKSKTVNDNWKSLCLHVFPELGHLPVTQISATRTIAVLKPIAAKGSLETVKRLCQRLNDIMNFAVNTGIVKANPLTGIRAAFAAPTKKHMATIMPTELPELFQALSSANIKTTTKCLLFWQLHTLCRPSEAAMAKWEEINFDQSIWVIPAEKMKMGREHVVPLTSVTIDILKKMQSISRNSPYIFPSDRDRTTHTNTQTANAALKRMGFKGRLVSHGFRAIGSTYLNEQGFPPDVIEAALAHTDKNEVRRAYNRSTYIEQRRQMMNAWSNHLSSTAKKSFAF